MPDIVILADTVRSPEMRRELPLAMVDPGIYIERDGTPEGVGHRLRDRARKAAVSDVEAVGLEELGFDAADRRRHVATRTRCTRS